MKLAFSFNGHLIPGLRLHLLPLLYSTSTSTSTGISPINSGNNSSFSDFLINSLGFDNNQSIDVTTKLVKRRHWRSTKDVSHLNSSINNAVSVVNYFKQLGFQQSQIKKIVAKEPRVLMSSIENCFKPKIKMLKELGVSDSDVVRMILSNNKILRCNLSAEIDAFRRVVGSDENVVQCLKRSRYIRCQDSLLPNVELLHNFSGAPIENINKFLMRSPEAFLVKTDVFRQVLVRVEQKLGIPPNSAMFMYGVQLLLVSKDKNLEKKFAVFKSFGWTQYHINELVRRHPLCLTSSESMIKHKLDFLMNHLGYTPDYLMKMVKFFTYSVDKRLLPRYRISQILNEKGKANCSLSSVSSLTESVFVKRYVLPFEEVHQVYAQLTGSKVGSLNVGRAKGQS